MTKLNLQENPTNGSPATAEKIHGSLYKVRLRTDQLKKSFYCLYFNVNSVPHMNFHKNPSSTS
jgi:hypothetical protein